MGCPSLTQLGDNLVFSICCHDPDTGVLTDADAEPTYRVYEDEDADPIATGTMSKLDDAFTTGFYTELLEVTTANEYESGKTYTIYIEATVDGDTGGISFAFKVDKILQQIAPFLAGTVTGAGTGEETFVYNGVTAKITVTAVGNVSSVVFS